jgi:hypothetical protein
MLRALAFLNGAQARRDTRSSASSSVGRLIDR